MVEPASLENPARIFSGERQLELSLFPARKWDNFRQRHTSGGWSSHFGRVTGDHLDMKNKDGILRNTDLIDPRSGAY